MEAFESFVALALETEELVVSEALKFPVAQQTTSGKQPTATRSTSLEHDLTASSSRRSSRSSARTAAERFGYQAHQVEMRLYVGKFAGAKTGEHRRRIETWCAQQQVGSGPIQVIGVEDVVARVRQVAQTNQYRDSAALVTMKLLDAAGVLTFAPPDQ
jgi:hypothetical protein